MKHLATIAVLSISVFLLSFKSPPPATTTTTNDVVPFATTVFIPCANGGAGEFVDLEGSLHIVTHLTVNGNGFSAKTHYQPQGVKGVGQTTGDQYNAVGGTQDQQSGSFNNGQYEFTYVNNFRIIGQGPGNNLQVHQNVHTTYNANGTATSTVSNLSSDCN